MLVLESYRMSDYYFVLSATCSVFRIPGSKTNSSFMKLLGKVSKESPDIIKPSINLLFGPYWGNMKLALFCLFMDLTSG